MRGLALADAGAVVKDSRRSHAIWALLGVSLAAAFVALVVQARAQASGKSLLPSGSNAVVVLDVSSSTRTASKSIARILRGLTRDPQRRLGLVLFSNTAYEALPPSTPADGLQGWLDRFAHSPPRRYAWSSFSGGTTISSGLVLARRVLHRDHVRNPHVILVSDLVDPGSDLSRLETAVAQYQRDGIDLKVVTVSQKATASPLGIPVQQPNATFLESAASATVDASRPAGTGTGPLVVVALVAAIALLVALSELLFQPFTWRPQP